LAKTQNKNLALAGLYDIATERAILGCAMTGGLEEIRDYLTPNDFGDPRHALIYRACLGVKEADPVTVAAEIRRCGWADRVDEAYLGSVVVAAYAPSQVRTYAEVVKRLSIRRQILQAGRLIMELAQDKNTEPEEALVKAREQIDKVVQHGTLEPVKLVNLVEARIEELTAGVSNKLLYTGFGDLDVLLGGFASGNLIVLAARPSMGKSSLGLQIAVNAAKIGKRALFFSLEMSASELVDRILAWEGGMDTVVMRRQAFLPEETERLWQVWPKTGEWELYLDCAPALNTAQIAATARKMKIKNGLDLVVVDYLQRMNEPPDKTINSRNELIGQITRRMKAIAIDLGVPVILLSQLNRAVESTPDKRPGLSHLRESGSIEQDADFVMFIYRRDYYFDEVQNKGKTEIIVAKQRNGPTGSVFLNFNRRLAMFSDLAEGMSAKWE